MASSNLSMLLITLFSSFLLSAFVSEPIIFSPSPLRCSDWTEFPSRLIIVREKKGERIIGGNF